MNEPNRKLKGGYDHVLINRHLQDLNPLFYGYERCLPNKSFGPAIRKYTLIHYVVEGEGRVYKQDGEYAVHAGQAFLILPDEIVTYTADAKNPWYYQWVAFDGALSEKFRELPTVIEFPSGVIREMLSMEERDLREYRVAALLFEMYAELFERPNPRNHYVRQVKDYIKALYMQPIRIEAIAEKMNLDRRYLSRIFKQKTGQTVQDYLISVRMEEAQRLLSQGKTVEEAAILCGYEDPFNFSKMFKRKFGVSPLQWKLGKREDKN